MTEALPPVARLTSRAKGTRNLAEQFFIKVKSHQKRFRCGNSWPRTLINRHSHSFEK